MGLAETLRAVLRPGVAPELAAAFTTEAPVVTQLGIASPWASPNHLATIAWADIFGADLPQPVTRAEAMSVPAAAAVRNVLCSIIAAVPLRAYRGPLDAPVEQLDRVEPQPTWINGTNQVLPPAVRMMWTVDDLLWFGWSCWSRVNGAGGFPVRMDRLPMGRWSFDGDGRVCVDRLDGRGHVPVPAHEVCLIPGPHEGLLTFAQDALRDARNLARAAGRAAHSPTAHTYLKQTGGPRLERAEIDELVADFARRRRATDGAVGFLNESIDVREGASFDTHLMVEGRNAAAVDLARTGGLPADLIDAAGESSMTYANSRDNDRRALRYGAGGYLLSISGALSQDAITPHGQRVAFDVESWLGEVPDAATSNRPTPPPSNPATPTEDPA